MRKGSQSRALARCRPPVTSGVVAWALNSSGSGLLVTHSLLAYLFVFPLLGRPAHLSAWGVGLYYSCMQEFLTLMEVGSQRVPGGALCSFQGTLPRALITFQGEEEAAYLRAGKETEASQG